MTIRDLRAAAAACAAGLLLACSGGPSAAPTAPPAPFDAEQIRAASPAGRTYVQRSYTADGASSLTTIRFVEVDAERATVEFTTGDRVQRHVMTWTDLAGHGRQPPGATRREARCTVPAGAFDCIIYETETADGRLRSSFARSLPGMPVRVERAVGDAWAPVMVVESHRAGGAP